jgi:hypothetical protein
MVTAGFTAALTHSPRGSGSPGPHWTTLCHLVVWSDRVRMFIRK